MKKIYVFAIMIILMSYAVTAFSSYPYIGYNSYRGDIRNYFNGVTVLEQDGLTGLKDININKSVLLGDVTGNGHNNIVLLDRVTLKVYENNTLNMISSIGTGCDGGNEGDDPYIGLHDFDADGASEIIVGCSDTTDGQTVIKIYNFTGQDLNKVISHQMGGYIEIIFACADNHRCLAVYIDDDSWDYDQNAHIFAHGFNYTTLSAQRTLDSGAVFESNCAPHIPFIDVVDSDIDGQDEFHFTYINTKQLEFSIFYFIVDVDADLLPDEEHQAEFSMGWVDGVYLTGCEKRGRGRFITAPLVGDFASDVGLEAVIGYATDMNDFKVAMFDKDGVYIKSFPDILEGDGELKGNPIRLNAFEDAENEIFCVLGYDDDEDILDLMCTEYERSGEDTEEFFAEINNAWDFSYEYGVYTMLTHATNALVSNDIDEVVTPFGIFALEEHIFGNDLILLYDNPLGEAGILMAWDVNNLDTIDTTDLIAVSASQIIYYDDGLENTPGEITNASINPSPDSIWKINTSVEVRIRVLDYDGDNVCMNATLYESDLTHEQDSATVCTVSGGWNSFLFTANKTGIGYEVILRGWDTENNRTIDTITKTFSVGINGVVYGESLWEWNKPPSWEDETPGEEALGTNTSVQPGNAIEDGIQELSGMTGLGTTITWLLIIVIVALFLTHKMIEEGHSSRLIASINGFWIVCMIIVGTYLKFIPTGLLVTLTVLGILGGAVIGGSWLFGQRQGMG